MKAKTKYPSHRRHHQPAVTKARPTSVREREREGGEEGEGRERWRERGGERGEREGEERRGGEGEGGRGGERA